MQRNKYGLARRIPNGIKRVIRQNAGFGCVICGCAIYQYEHVDPTFEGAKSHNPKYMTLLCGTCHDQVTRGIFSKEKVKEAMKNPKCKENGFSFGCFEVGDVMPQIFVSGCSFQSSDGLVLIEVDGEDLLKFERPEIAGGPFLLSANFYNNEGSPIFSINKNEWMGDVQNWDIELIGQKITIRKKLSEISLEIINVPRESLQISKIDMIYGGYRVVGNDRDGINFLSPSGSGLEFKRCSFDFGNENIKKVAFELGNAITTPRMTAVHLG